MLTKILLIGTALAIIATSAARAADIEVPVGYDWSGAYAGLHAGYGWGHTEGTGDGTWNGTPGVTGDEFNASVDGFVGGGQIGYNFQFDNIVTGVEGDLGYLGVEGRDLSNLDTDTRLRTAGGLYGTLRGRLGFAADNMLFYATGGLIFADLGSEVYHDSPGVSLRSDDTGTRLGWTAGGGIEWAFSDEWSFKAEYLYYDLGSETVRGERTPSFGVTYPFEVENTGNIARAGVNFHF